MDRFPQGREKKRFTRQRHSPSDNDRLGRDQRNHLGDGPAERLRRALKDGQGPRVAVPGCLGRQFARDRLLGID